jgi:hypothetical protein
MDQENVVYTHLYNGILFSHKKNEILSFAGKWMELESIILSEVSQVQKAKGHMFPFICGIETQYKYKQYYIYIQIYTNHVPKSGTGRVDEGRRKRRKYKE